MKKKSKSQFVRLDHSLLDSPAFVGASNTARCLLLLLVRKFNGRNNGSIDCGVREAASWLHASKDTASRAFGELESLGLIAPMKLGHFEIKAGEMKNVATSWRLNFVEAATNA